MVLVSVLKAQRKIFLENWNTFRFIWKVKEAIKSTTDTSAEAVKRLFLNIIREWPFFMPKNHKSDNRISHNFTSPSINFLQSKIPLIL